MQLRLERRAVDRGIPCVLECGGLLDDFERLRDWLQERGNGSSVLGASSIVLLLNNLDCFFDFNLFLIPFIIDRGGRLGLLNLFNVS